jgi:hypothetical protein
MRPVCSALLPATRLLTKTPAISSENKMVSGKGARAALHSQSVVQYLTLCGAVHRALMERVIRSSPSTDCRSNCLARRPTPPDQLVIFGDDATTRLLRSDHGRMSPIFKHLLLPSRRQPEGAGIALAHPCSRRDSTLNGARDGRKPRRRLVGQHCDERGRHNKCRAHERRHRLALSHSPATVGARELMPATRRLLKNHH